MRISDGYFPAILPVMFKISNPAEVVRAPLAKAAWIFWRPGINAKLRLKRKKQPPPFVLLLLFSNRPLFECFSGATGKLSTIQNDIFKQVHKTFVESHLKDTIGILNYTYGQTDDLKRLQNSGDKLRSLLKSADYLEKSARFPPAIDHVEEFMTASRLSRFEKFHWRAHFYSCEAVSWA